MKHEREQRTESALSWLLGYLREQDVQLRQQQGVEALDTEQCGAIWSRVAEATKVIALDDFGSETRELCLELRVTHLAKLNAAIAKHGEYHEEVGIALYDFGILRQNLETYVPDDLEAAEALFRRACDVFAIVPTQGNYYAMCALRAQAEVLLALGRPSEAAPLMRRVTIDWGKMVAGAHHFPCFYEAESGYRVCLRAEGRSDDEIVRQLTSAREEAGFRARA